jgi:dihydrofolate reductase
VSVGLSTHSVSLDGYMARTDGQAGRLNAWLFGSDERQLLHLSDESREVFDALVSRIGAAVVGRNTYDTASGWGGMPPFDWPFFVVTHHPPENAEELPSVFVTEGLERAIALAKEAAGGRDVSVMGGDMTRQALSAGLIDELHLDLVSSSSEKAFASSTPEEGRPSAAARGRAGCSARRFRVLRLTRGDRLARPAPQPRTSPARCTRRRAPTRLARGVLRPTGDPGIGGRETERAASLISAIVGVSPPPMKPVSVPQNAG